MSCIYCDRNYSTVWEQEDRKYKLIPIQELEKLETSKNNYPAMLQAHWDWLHLNHDKLALYNILGGEPFFQPELEQNIDFFIDHPSPNLTIFIFSNLKVDNSKLKRLVGKLADLKSTGKIKSCRICCSIDCWGKEAEYIRTGLQLDKWEQNLLTLLNDFPEIDLHIHTTLTSLALKTFPRLNEKINEWNKIRSISSDFSFVDCQPQLHPGIFPANFFKADFDAAAAAMGENSSLIDVLRGFENTINSLSHEPNRIDELKLFLSSLDDKRNTDWKSTFGWLNTYE
jgi:wyosine [tRNA(Phe)-imidazoG37] synthetase (radical SAM superfamily)